jgi:phosphatidylserine/phosphatidylglycerophosphate/cardiolipin synthase-like enzyme
VGTSPGRDARGLARGVDITFLIREDATPRRPEDLEWFRANRIKVYLVPNLHAKIYLNEKRVIVSSMNIHRTSIIDSKDFAMVVKNEGVAKMFREYVSRLVGKAAIPKASHPIRDYVSGLVKKDIITTLSFDHQNSAD